MHFLKTNLSGVTSTQWMWRAVEAKAKNHIETTGKTSWILLGSQHWRKGTVSASNSLSLSLCYDQFSGLPGDFPKFSLLLKHFHPHCFDSITAILSVTGAVQHCKTHTLENVLKCETMAHTVINFSLLKGIQNVLSSSSINPNSFKSSIGIFTSCINRIESFFFPSLCSNLCCSMRELSDATVINYLCKMIMHMINQTQHAYTML